MLPGAVAMNPATAVLFVLAAFSLILEIVFWPTPYRAHAARLVARVVLAVGVFRLCEYGFGFDVGFDLFQDSSSINVIHTGAGHPLPHRPAEEGPLSRACSWPPGCSRRNRTVNSLPHAPAFTTDLSPAVRGTPFVLARRGIVSCRRHTPPAG